MFRVLTKVLPCRMLTHQERGIRRIRTPAHGAIEELLISEIRQIRGDGLPYGHLGDVGVRVRRMFGVRSGHGNIFQRRCSVRLVLLVAGESREFVTDFYHAVSSCAVRIAVHALFEMRRVTDSLGSKKKPTSPL